MKRKLGKWTLLIATASLMAALLSSCSWSIGSERGHGYAAQPTRGQELTDLKKARDAGAITEEEYQAQKNRVLGR